MFKKNFPQELLCLLCQKAVMLHTGPECVRIQLFDSVNRRILEWEGLEVKKEELWSMRLIQEKLEKEKISEPTGVW